jgi:nucleoid DNA-binding protein
MKKADLLKEVAEKAQTTGKIADAVIVALTDTIITETTAGNDIKVPGLGTFKPVVKAARKITYPEKAALKFKIEKGFSTRFVEKVSLKELKKATKK